MKIFIITLVLAGNVFFISCKKERTCSCKYQSTNTEVTTPRGTPQPSTTTSSGSGEVNQTHSKVKKDDMVRILGCNDRTEKTSDTYTTTISVPSVTSVGGFTFMTSEQYTADVSSTNSTEYTCEIK